MDIIHGQLPSAIALELVKRGIKLFFIFISVILKWSSLFDAYSSGLHFRVDRVLGHHYATVDE